MHGNTIDVSFFISSYRPSRAQRRVLLAYLGLAPQAIDCHASGVQNHVPYWVGTPGC